MVEIVGKIVKRQVCQNGGGVAHAGVKGHRTQSDGSLAIVLVTLLQTVTKQDSISTQSNRSDTTLAMFLVTILQTVQNKIA